MGRLVILVLLTLVVAWWIFSRIGKLRGDKKPPAAQPGRTSDMQEMVACAHCGTHVPLSDAVQQGALHYCGEPHRLLGPRR